jgi:micrococcal nuclease
VGSVLPSRVLGLYLAAFFAALAACGLAGCAGLGGGAQHAGERIDGRVTRVIDGDTAVVSTPGHPQQRVRFIGIDTPESVKPDTPVQCYAELASHETKRLLTGQQVTLQLDRDVYDRYGRLLAYVYRRSDGLLVNRLLVADGYARTLVFPPNTAHRAEFARLAATARARNLGLWGACGRS